MDELHLARARYEETLKNDPEFDENLDFVLFRDHFSVFLHIVLLPDAAHP